MSKTAFWESALTFGIRWLTKFSAILITAYASLWIYQILARMTSPEM